MFRYPMTWVPRVGRPPGLGFSRQSPGGGQPVPDAAHGLAASGQRMDRRFTQGGQPVAHPGPWIPEDQ